MTASPTTLDAQVVVVQTLASSAAVAAALAALANPAGGVWGEAKGPFPSIEVLSAPGGDWRRGTWNVTDAAQINVWGNADRSSSKDDLRGVLAVALEELLGLPERVPPIVAGMVVVDVAVLTPPQPLPEPDGQPRWFSTVLLGLHPVPA